MKKLTLAALIFVSVLAIGFKVSSAQQAFVWGPEPEAITTVL